MFLPLLAFVWGPSACHSVITMHQLPWSPERELKQEQILLEASPMYTLQHCETSGWLDDSLHGSLCTLAQVLASTQACAG
jgi:hypothetical protein